MQAFDISTMPEELQDYWTEGEGAAEIGWGTDGDFGRCQVALRREGVPGRMIDGACANLHKRATGQWPGQKGTHTVDTEYTLPSLVAAGGQSVFANPNLTGPTPLTVTDDGRVYGHLALWSTCHIGFDGACVTPPRSATNYAHFLNKEAVTEDGPVAVGAITLGTGHAAARLGARPAAAHYDDTGLAVAYVTAGEDAHGIWVAGRLGMETTSAQIEKLRGAALSGDWRRIGGNLELVAALAVNVPGFPIPRLVASVAGGQPNSLVASGLVPVPVSAPEPPEVLVASGPAPTMDSIAAAATKRAIEIIDRRSRLTLLDKGAGHDPATRVARAAALIERN